MAHEVQGVFAGRGRPRPRTIVVLFLAWSVRPAVCPCATSVAGEDSTCWGTRPRAWSATPTERSGRLRDPARGRAAGLPPRRPGTLRHPQQRGDPGRRTAPALGIGAFADKTLVAAAPPRWTRPPQIAGLLGLMDILASTPARSPDFLWTRGRGHRRTALVGDRGRRTSESWTTSAAHLDRRLRRPGCGGHRRGGPPGDLEAFYGRDLRDRRIAGFHLTTARCADRLTGRSGVVPSPAATSRCCPLYLQGRLPLDKVTEPSEIGDIEAHDKMHGEDVLRSVVVLWIEDGPVRPSSLPQATCRADHVAVARPVVGRKRRTALGLGRVRRRRRDRR